MTKFEQMFLRRNPKYAFLLSRMREAMNLKEIDFDDINSHNLWEFKEYMQGEVAANSLRLYCAVIKAFVNECVADGLIKSAKCLSALSVKAEPQQNVALTADELEKLEDYYDRICQQGGTEAEKDVLTLFLIECLCGARGCDVEQLASKNISNGMMTYVSKKTHVMAVVPQHRRIPALLRNKPHKEYSRMTKNRVIKRALRNCGVTDEVTIFYHGSMVTKQKCELCGMHTARRTFASILAEKGAPIIEIAQFMGHTNTAMTNRYIKVNTQQMSSAARSFFM